MLWSVILASLKKRSHSASLSFGRSKPVVLPHDRTSPLQNLGSSPFSQTCRSSSHSFAITNSIERLSSSRVSTRKASSHAQIGQNIPSRGYTESISTCKPPPPPQGTAKPTGSPAGAIEEFVNKRIVSSASEAASASYGQWQHKAFKAPCPLPARTREAVNKYAPSCLPEASERYSKASSHARDEDSHIARLESTRRVGDIDGQLSSNNENEHANRYSCAQLAFQKTAFINNYKKNPRAPSINGCPAQGCDDVNVGNRTSTACESGRKGTANLKAWSHKFLPDIPVASSGSANSSGGQVLSGEGSVTGNWKVARNVAKRPACSSEQSGGINEGGQNVKGEPRKPFLQAALPVTVFADWWFNCFLGSSRLFPCARFPLDKLYIWLGAYQRAHLDATGKYIDYSAVAALSKQLEDLKDAVTSGVFKWDDRKHTYVPSPPCCDKEGSRFLSDADTAFSFQDRVVQELLYLVLEPIFETRFSTRSHASRPGRDVHTALRAAQRSFLGCTWFISADLGILQEGRYASYLVDSALRVVKDSRVASLLKSGFLGSCSQKLKLNQHSLFTSATQGSCGRLKHLLFNALLDELDWWMDEQISNYSKGKFPSCQPPEESLHMSARTLAKPPYKLEYVRYGTKFWVGCNGAPEEMDLLQKEIISFLKLKFGKDFQCGLSVSHISAGVNMLDHVISQKIVRLIFKRRRATSGRVFEKQAFRIKLSVKASIEHCSEYLKQARAPLSLQHIEEVLSILNQWYCYAENREKVISHCRLSLCSMYAKAIIDTNTEDSMMSTEFAEQFKRAALSVGCSKMEDGHPGTAKNFIRIPEHEKVLRDHAWLQSRAVTIHIRDSFKNMEKLSPQQSMSQVLWQFLRTANSGSGGDLEDGVQSSSIVLQESTRGVKLEELAESVG